MLYVEVIVMVDCMVDVYGGGFGYVYWDYEVQLCDVDCDLVSCCFIGIQVVDQ